MANEKALKILLFDDSGSYLRQLTESLADEEIEVYLERTVALDAIDSTLEIKEWNCLIAVYSDLNREEIQVNKWNFPFILLCEPQEEAEAFTWLDLGVSDVVSVARLEHLPFILRRELKRYSMQVESGSQNATAEQRQYEESLRRSEARFRLVIEGFSDVILMTDGYQIVRYANAALNSVLGYQMPEVLGRQFKLLLHADEKQAVEARFSQLLSDLGTSQSLEHRMRRADGEWEIVETAAQSMVDPLGQPMLILHIHSITKRRQAEEELKQYTEQIEHLIDKRTNELYYAKEQVEIILNNSTDGISLIDGDFHIQQTNPAFNHMLGMENENSLEKGLLDYIHEADLFRVQTAIEKVIREHIALNFEVRIIRQDGIVFEAELSLGYIKTDGVSKTTSFVCTIRDITKRKRTEARFRGLLESAPDAMVIVNQTGQIILINTQTQQLFGYKAEELIGESVDKLVPERFRVKHPLNRSHYFEAPRVRAMGVGIELYALRKDGSEFPVEVSLSPLQTEDGTLVSSAIRDITERKLQDRQLRFYASLQQNISDSVISTDMEFRIQSWNRAAERIYGWQEEEVKGRSVVEILPTRYISEDDNLSAINQLNEHGWWQGEVCQSRKDGSELYILGSVTLIKDENGLPLGVVSVNRDITERKQVEAALQKSSAEIHDLYNNAPCGYHSIDKDGLIVQINDTELRWLGYSRDEVVGKIKITEIFTPESLLLFQRTFPAFMERGWMNDIEVDMVSKDSSIRRILLNATAIYDENGQFLRSRSTLFDITELQQAQRAVLEKETSYRLLAENISDVIVKMNPNGIRTFVTASCYELLGYTSEELTGKLGMDIVHPDDRPKTMSIMLQAFRTGQSSFSVVQRIRHRARHYIWVEVKSTVVRDFDSGEVIEVIGVIRDITERKRAEEALRESEERYRLLAENIADMIMTFSPDRVITYMSPSCERLLGYLPEEIEGKSHRDFIHPEDYPQVIDKTRQAVATKEYFYTNQFRLQHKTGQYIWYEVLTRIVFDPNTENVVQFISVLRDITERKQAEIALRESEMRYRLLAENITDVIIRVTPEGVYLYVSPSSKSIMGYEPEEMIGKSIYDFAHPDDVERVRKFRQETYALNLATPFTYQFVHSKGHVIWIEVVRKLISSDVTGDVEYISSARDVTARKQAEEALEQNERLLRLILDSLPVGVWIIETQGNITFGNPAGQQIWAGAKYVGLEEFGEYKAWRVDSGKKIESHEWAAARAITTGEISLDEELEIEAFDGTRKFILNSGIPIRDENGDILGAITVNQDITERKRIASELERQRIFLRQVIDVSPSMIFVKDYDSRFVLVNPIVAKMYQTTVEELIGKTDADFSHISNEVNAFLEGDRHVIDTGEPLFIEEPITSPSGEVRWLQTTKVPIISEDGVSKYVLGVSTDITERKKSEEVLRQALAKEKELGELKSRFVSMASHEFRTPLATILAMVDTISAYRHQLSEEKIELRFERIRNQIEHLKDIMEDVLLLSRMQARKVEFNPTTVDLDALFRSVLDEFQTRPEIKHELDYSVVGSVYPVLADRKLIRQIVTNLVSNAIKYSPDVKPIHIRLEFTDSNVTFAVRDEGIGIPEADLKHLFEPFHRAANVGAISGTGLGLVIVKESVELHKGTITVESKAGIGTSFTIQIPTHGGNDHGEDFSN